MEEYIKKSEVMEMIQSAGALYKMIADENLAGVLSNSVNNLSKHVEGIKGIQLSAATTETEFRALTDSPFPISFEDFQKTMRALQAAETFQQGLIALVNAYNRDAKDDAELLVPSLSNTVISLLERLTDDRENTWISYFIYDLDFGKDYDEGMVAWDDDKEHSLTTIEDLWNVLKWEYERK